MYISFWILIPVAFTVFMGFKYMKGIINILNNEVSLHRNRISELSESLGSERELHRAFISNQNFVNQGLKEIDEFMGAEKYDDSTRIESVRLFIAAYKKIIGIR